MGVVTLVRDLVGNVVDDDDAVEQHQRHEDQHSESDVIQHVWLPWRWISQQALGRGYVVRQGAPRNGLALFVVQRGALRNPVASAPPDPVWGGFIPSLPEAHLQLSDHNPIWRCAMTMKVPVALGLATALLLSGCASDSTRPEQYSGFLADYSALQPAQSASGAPIMRWVSPGFDLQRYSSVLVERPQFYPAPQPSAQVSQQTLDAIASYLQQAMQRELAGRLRIVEQADQDTLVLRSAISAVNLSPEGLKVYEVVPVALVAAAASTVAGTRDLNTEIYVELEALDARSSAPMARVVRKGHGLQLENDSTQLRLEDIKPALDVWAQDARDFKP
ncbi:DUF3313 domain-containing protein [Pseudomonas zhanjiangensis]|uniref:DUF3313 domain-containing protein n=1 Tax=Pseudomonas zhanjiangensis TaxID=3239015 RepID=A0ABV3YUU8_9PSED